MAAFHINRNGGPSANRGHAGDNGEADGGNCHLI